jgi:hypothetical protein
MTSIQIMTLLVVLSLLACWRLARLLTVDEVFAPVRERVAKRSDTWAYFVTCPWCLSIWTAPLVAIPVVLWSDFNDPWLWIVVISLAGSLTAGIGQTVEDRLDR